MTLENPVETLRTTQCHPFLGSEAALPLLKLAGYLFITSARKLFLLPQCKLVQYSTIDVSTTRTYNNTIIHTSTQTMGILSQSTMFYKTKYLSMDTVINLVKLRYDSIKCELLSIRERACVVIDASLVGFKYVGTSTTPATGVVTVAQAFTDKNIDVIIVLDGGRHHSKRAIWKRSGEREAARIRAAQQRVALCEILRNGASGDTVCTIEKEIKKLDNKAKRLLPTSFEDDLRKEVEKIVPSAASNKGFIAIKKSNLQADPEIARLAVHGCVDAVVSNDSDFPMYIGPTIFKSDLLLHHQQISKGTVQGFGHAATGQQSVKFQVQKFLAPFLG
jgi:hypothetical protein